MRRRDFLTQCLTGTALLRISSAAEQDVQREVFLERPAAGTLHKGKENPDHSAIARGVEAACWMAGRDHDYPEQFVAGLKPHAVQEKYYYARRPEITRVVDIGAVIDQKVEANRANQAKGPAGRHGSRLRAELARKNLRLPLLGDDDSSADRNYIKEFVLARNRELGRKYGVQYAEAFHYIGPGISQPIDDYVRTHAAPLR